MPRSRLSRRRFIAMIAAATAAGSDALAATKDAKPRSAKKKAPAAKDVKITIPPVYAAPPAPSPETARGIAQQKEWLAASLRVIRTYDLPPGSEQAFAFVPLKAKKP